VPTEPAATSRPWWLLGLMGSGKSTVGRAAALAAGRRYVDNDATIAARAGRSTSDLAMAGGSVLHEWEAAYIRELTEEGGPLVAGIPASCSDRRTDLELLAASGMLVYLRCSPATLVSRVLAGPRRPWLSGSAEDTEALVARMFAARDRTMSAFAEVILDGEQHVDALVTELLDSARRSGSQQARHPSA
jgi:shikimate kinase